MVEADSALAVTSGREADDAASFTVDRRGDHSACVRWSIPQFSKLTQKSTRCLWSKYFDVGGYDCRVLVYPAGPLPISSYCNVDIATAVCYVRTQLAVDSHLNAQFGLAGSDFMGLTGC